MDVVLGVSVTEGLDIAATVELITIICLHKQINIIVMQ